MKRERVQLICRVPPLQLTYQLRRGHSQQAGRIGTGVVGSVVDRVLQRRVLSRITVCVQQITRA